MSSSYSVAELEAMRKAKVLAELNEGIEKLKLRLQTSSNNDIEEIKRGNYAISVFSDEEVFERKVEANAVNEEDINSSFNLDTEYREEIDFSKLLFAVARENVLLVDLKEWINKVENRGIYRKKDEVDRARLLKALEMIIQDQQMDVEEKIQGVKMRVESYLSHAYELTVAEQDEINRDYLHYVALCQMLDITPREKYPYRVRCEIDRMQSVLEKRAQNEYIMETIQDILTDMGCTLKGEAILDHVQGMTFSVNGNEICDVFVGNDGNGLMFEPIVQTKKESLTANDIQNDIGHVCSLYKEMEDRAFDKDIVFKHIYMDSVDAKQCCREERVTTQKKNKKKSISHKLKTLSQEG